VSNDDILLTGRGEPPVIELPLSCHPENEYPDDGVAVIDCPAKLSMLNDPEGLTLPPVPALITNVVTGGVTWLNIAVNVFDPVTRLPMNDDGEIVDDDPILVPLSCQLLNV